MAGPDSWMIFATLGFFHAIGNLFLTKDVFDNYPFKKERVLLSVLLWTIPIVGAFYVFRKIGLEHYKSNESSNTGVSVGLLGMNEIFNPSIKQKYSIEAMLEDRNEIKDGRVSADEKRDTAT